MSKIAGVLFIISFVFIIGFVLMRDSLVKEPEVEKKIPRKTSVISPAPTMSLPASSQSTLKIAVPEGLRVELVDPQGVMSGTTLTGFRNDIVNSEVKVDEMLGTVTWILLTPPQSPSYTLKVTGSSDKAIAIYVKNSAGFEGLELLETQAHDAQKTYLFTVAILQDTAQKILKIDAL